MPRLVSLAALLFLVFLAPAAALEAGNMTQVVEAEGSHLMGDNDSRRQARDMALLQAKRACMEKAGTFLSSRTEVENFQMDKDEIFSRAAARIQAEVVDEKWEHVGDTLQVTLRIRAVVRPEDFDVEDLEAESGAAWKRGPADGGGRTPDRERAAEREPGQARDVDQVRRDLEGQAAGMRPPEPEDPSRMLDLFYARLQREEYQEALRVANRLVNRYPRMGEAYFARALLFKRIGRTRRGMADLSRACELGHKAACRTLSEARRRFEQNVHNQPRQADPGGQRTPPPQQRPVQGPPRTY